MDGFIDGSAGHASVGPVLGAQLAAQILAGNRPHRFDPDVRSGTTGTNSELHLSSWDAIPTGSQVAEPVHVRPGFDSGPSRQKINVRSSYVSSQHKGSALRHSTLRSTAPHRARSPTKVSTAEPTSVYKNEAGGNIHTVSLTGVYKMHHCHYYKRAAAPQLRALHCHLNAIDSFPLHHSLDRTTSCPVRKLQVHLCLLPLLPCSCHCPLQHPVQCTPKHELLRLRSAEQLLVTRQFRTDGSKQEQRAHASPDHAISSRMFRENPFSATPSRILTEQCYSISFDH